ncbi:MAG: nitrogen fixation protein NifH [Spirochaetota bacterium]|nr:MAG: nitrogen fixation protein NifH [Spirochaetota bacterium]
MNKLSINEDILGWLSEKENPSVRYLTLLQLLKKTSTSEEVIEAKDLIMTHGVVPQILQKQNPGGYWVSLEDFYIRTKYSGTVWTLILLAELYANGNDKRIRDACEVVLRYSQEPASGGFAYKASNTDKGGDHDCILPCLTGNMVFSLIRLGLLKDSRVQDGIDWITKYLRFDDGDGDAPSGWPYDRLEKCWGKHTCYIGVVRCIKALAEIPDRYRSEIQNETTKRSVRYILDHRVYKKSHDACTVANDRWISLGFPLMWDIDVLEVLDILLKLGKKAEQMQDAIDLILSKKNDEGKWLLERTFNGRMQIRIEKKNEPSKWITFRALSVLQRYYDK